MARDKNGDRFEKKNTQNTVEGDGDGQDRDGVEESDK